MYLSVFAKYKVRHKCTYSVKRDYGDFEVDSFEKVFELSGSECIALLYKFLVDCRLFSVFFVDSSVFIDLFDALSGEDEEHYFIFEDID